MSHMDNSSHGSMERSMNKKHYSLLGIMAIISFISMYALMYAMVDSFADIYSNFNQFYMAGLMTAPMIIIEVLLMRMMYPDKKLNFIIITISSIALITFFLMIRQQIGISDKQFLKSMIVHHSSAVLMCNKAPIQDPEIRELCKNILSSQQEQIGWMNAKLDKLK